MCWFNFISKKGHSDHTTARRLGLTKKNENDMATIDKHTEDKIKDSTKIAEVFDDFGYDLKKKGVNYQCLCPFHDDRHIGSFVVSPRKNTYSCYSCGAHGDAIEFLMKKQGLSYPDALRWLAKKYSIVIPEDEKESWSDRLNAIIEKAKQAEARRLSERQQVLTKQAGLIVVFLFVIHALSE